MAVNLSPIGNDAPFVDANGNPLTGGQIFTYTAGSSTKQNTYTTSAGNVANANPILLNSNGYPVSAGNVVEIWLTAGVVYKFVLATATDSDPPSTPIWTRDNISGINDTTTAIDQWVAGPAPTYISATSFSLVGDQTGTFQAGRRVKTTNSGGTIYSTISTSVFGAVTTVTVVNDSGTLDSGLSAVSYGLLSATNPSIPRRRTRQVLLSGTGATYTTPTGCTMINVRMVGGGGGGSAVTTNNGAVGTSTTFGTLTAAFGSGGIVGTAGGAGGGATNGDINLTGQSGAGFSNNTVAGVAIVGSSGGSSVFGGGGASSGTPSAGQAGIANTGGGGQGGAGSSTTATGSGGGAGGYCEKLIVGPAATYTYTVGAGGAAGAAGGVAGGAGGTGIIIVDEWYT